MPRTKEQNEQIKKEKRARILQVAIESFARNGYGETTIANVAKAAGVSFGTVFNYFPSKEELFSAAVVEPLASIREHVVYREGRYDGTPVEQIRQMVAEHVFLFVRQAPYLRLVQYVLGQPDRFPEQFAELDRFFQSFKDALRPLVERGQEAGDLHPCHSDVVAATYFCYLNGIRLTVTDPPDNHEMWQAFTEQGVLLFRPR
ncbi:MAG TPA: TetR/AcrR family transcriptional regulator [Bacilli bacterium]|nr:TetR/AcrR family transcriptional regulator [Bacilli bacterium]